MMKNAHLDAAGKFTSRGEWIHGEITTVTTEIIIVTEGVVHIEEDGVRYSLAAGDVLLLSPGISHRGYEVSYERVSFYWLHLRGFDVNADGAPAKCFTLCEPHHVGILCRQLMHYKQNGAGADITDRFLYILLYELSSQSRSDDGGESALVGRIREWIRINSDRNISAPDVARKFGYNEDYISRLCRRYYGAGLKALIVELKIGLINQQLLETELTLSEIADATGFSDYKLFLKFFKYHTGMTPSEYRRVYYAIHTNNR